MKLIGYPHAHTPPWPPLDEDDIDWWTLEDGRKEYQSRDLNHNDEMISLFVLHYNLNSKLLWLRCRHEHYRYTDTLRTLLKELSRREYELAEWLNPPIYQTGDELEYRMFPQDEPMRVRINETYFNHISGRGYRFEVIGRPNYHIPGARKENLTPIGLRNLESEAAKSSQCADAAHATFRNLGSWRDQRSAYQRRTWQLAKLNVASAEREAREASKELAKPVRLLLTYSKPDESVFADASMFAHLPLWQS